MQFSGPCLVRGNFLHAFSKQPRLPLQHSHMRFFCVLRAENARVMVLAATNRPWELDEAILRRLPRAFEVGMPDKQQRASILKVILKDEVCEPCLDIEQLAILTEGYSGSDLTELCKQAAYMPIRDLLDEERVQVDGLAEIKVCDQYLPFAFGRNFPAMHLLWCLIYVCEV